VRGNKLKKLGLLLIFLGVLIGTNTISFDRKNNEFIVAGTPALATTGGRTNSSGWNGPCLPLWI
jgi:hypothetical protein